jgi:hypothetical protein
VLPVKKGASAPHPTEFHVCSFRFYKLLHMCVQYESFVSRASRPPCAFAHSVGASYVFYDEVEASSCSMNL